MSEKLTRKMAVRALEKVFTRPASPPFDTMTDDEIMEFVDREIAAYRKEKRMRNGVGAEIGFTFFWKNAMLKAEVFLCP
jgi:hypothetical protein